MELILNRVWATLASGMDALQANLPLTTGHGVRFGSIAAGKRVRIVFIDAANNVSEVAYVTGVTGDNGTVLRGQDGTTAVPHLAGERIEARAGRSTMEKFRQPEHIQDGAETLLGSVTGTNTITAAANPTLIAQAAVGSMWKLPAAGANAGAVTLNIDGQGAVSVVRPDGSALQASDIPGANYLCQFQKRAADFVLLNPAGLSSQQLSSVASQSQSQAQAQTGIAFTTGGSGTAFTLTPAPAISGLAASQRFRVTFHAAAGATPTLAISGLAAKSLKYKDQAGAKQAVTSAQVPAGWSSDVEYDGTDYVVLNTPQNGKDFQIFTANGTWTKPSWCSGNELVIVELWGGGGGSASGNSGGGGGGYCRREYFASQLPASVAVVVGAGGIGGNPGGTSSFYGIFSTAYGGGPAGNNAGGTGGSNRATGGSAVASVAYSTLDTGGTGGVSGHGANGGGWGGGGGGATIVSSTGGASLYGGGGGGGGGAGGTPAGGVSLFGGNGGALGVDGAIPGGGGGALANGARGEVRVRVLA